MGVFGTKINARCRQSKYKQRSCRALSHFPPWADQRSEDSPDLKFSRLGQLKLSA